MRLPPALLLFALCASALCLPGCRLPGSAATPPAAAVQAHGGAEAARELFREFGGEEAFLQTAHFLYRWVLDENDFKRRDASLQGQLWLRRVQTVADAQDNSRFLELVLPAMGVAVSLKKTDYRIPELKLDVRSAGYRVTRVSRDTFAAEDVREYARLDFAPEDLHRLLFQERLSATFPDENLFARMRECAAREIEGLDLPPAGKGINTVYFAPIHAVANELWAFWQEGKLLFHFTSDIDLTNPDVWAQDTLGVTLYDTARQTVVSHEERPGDSRFITRDQVGRALYNCIVLGRAATLPDRAPAP